MDLDWFGTPLKGDARGKTATGQSVAASLRLENALVSPDRPDTANAVQTHVTSQVFKGSRTAVDLRVSGPKDATFTVYCSPDRATRLMRGRPQKVPG